MSRMEPGRPVNAVMPKSPVRGIGLKLGLRLYFLLVAILLPTLLVYYLHNFRTIEKVHDQEVSATARRTVVRIDSAYQAFEKQNAVIRKGPDKDQVEKDLADALAQFSDQLKRIRDDSPGVDSVGVFSATLESVAAHGPNAPTKPTAEDLKAAASGAEHEMNIQRDRAKFRAFSAPLRAGSEARGLVHLEVTPDSIGFGVQLPELRMRLLVGAAGMILIVGLGVAFYFHFAVGRPIKQLVNAMERTAEGDLGALVDAGSGELGWLAGSYNQMIRALKTSVDENQRLLDQIKGFNEELQKKIRLATEELGTKNVELQAANDRLFALQRQMTTQEKLATLGHVATTIAHELGTPLNAISGHLQLMIEDHGLDDRTQERLKVISSQVDRLTSIVREVLKSMRLPPPRRETINLNHVIEDVVDLVTPTARKASIQLVPALNRDLPLIMADADQLEQVLMNLFTNAMDAMPRGGVLTLATSFVTPELSAQVSQESGIALDGSYLRLDVTDTGEGMDDATVRRIFQPFFTTKDGPDGSASNLGVGLGLSIVRLIITGHRGEISVRTGKGRGTTLSLFLPIERERVMT